MEKFKRINIIVEKTSGKFATIKTKIFNPLTKKDEYIRFSGCEVLQSGIYKKNVMLKNIGLDYLYF